MRISTLLPLLLAGSLHAKDVLFEAFESDGFGEWKVEGSAFGLSPTASSPDGLNGRVKNFSNNYYVSSAHQGDASVGSLTSPEFTIDLPYLTFLISGGNHADKTAAQLLIDGKVVKTSSGQNNLMMRASVWNVSDLKGKKARFRILDDERGAWGIINVDHIFFTDYPNPKFPATTKDGKPHEEGLVSTDVIPGLTVPEGASVKIFTDNKASGLYSPTALTIDEQGRVYAAETHRFRFGVEDNRNHLYWLMDDISAQTTDDRVAMHQKWQHKLPLEKMTKVSEKIRVFVDADGDGVADESKIYADGFNDLLDGTAAGVMAFEGTIYFACIPKIWALQDENGDLVSDARSVIQDGMGVRVSFSGHDLNGFALGPDGRIYSTLGDRGFSFTTKEGKSYKFPGQGAIFRFDPDGSNFEVVHTGLRNPKEIAFDKYGTAVSVDNNSDQGDRARVVIMMDGADSGWRMGHQVLHSFHTTAGIPERPVNRWMQEKMWEPQNKTQPAYILPPIANLSSGPSGLAYHPGTGFELGCKDQFLICDYRGGPAASGMWNFGIEPNGAGFAISESSKFSWGTAVTDVDWGYDGKLYVSDFITGWKSHEAGRIYTITQPGVAEDPTANEVAALFKKGFSTFDAQTLAGLLGHADMRVRLRAQYFLAGKKEALALFTAAANQNQNELERLHGVWGLGMLARKNNDNNATSFLARLLNNKDANVRGQAAQALGESPLADSAILLPLLKDESIRVRALTALALSRKPHPDATAELLNILAENNNYDPYLRHAATMALISCAGADVIAALHSNESPAIRLAAVVALRRLNDDRVVNFLTDSDGKVADEVIRAIHDTSMENVRPALTALLDDYATDGPGRKLTRMMLRRLIYSGYRIGGEKNMARLIKIASNEKLDKNERLDVLRLLSIWDKPHVVDQSLGKHNPLPARDAAATKAALAANIAPLLSDDSEILGKALALTLQYGLSLDALDSGSLTRLARDEKLDGATRSEALSLLLAGNPGNAAEILTELAQSKDDALATTALKLASERDPAANVAALKGALKSDSTSRRQTAWKIAAKLPAEHAVPIIRDELSQLNAGKGDPSSALELLEAAQLREEPAIKSALETYRNSLPKDDIFATWAPTLSGGDAKAGFKIFQSHGAAQCMRCHRHEPGHSEGGDAGPSLMGVALRQDARGLLESMIAPSAKIASGFGLASVKLNNGQEKTGMILRDADESIDLKEGEDVWKIAHKDIEKTTTLPSSMPPMGTILKPGEVRDLIAWLLTLTKESGETPAAYQAKELELAKAKPEPTNPTSTPATPKDMPEETTSNVDPAIMELGKKLYDTAGSCVTCHQPNGEGLANVFPPLAESEWVVGPTENLVKIQLQGLMGPIKVKGTTYNGAMPAISDAIFPQTDENIAAVITYVRNSFGNSAPIVTPEMVATIRAEGGTGMLTADMLLPPIPEITIPTGPLAEIPSSGLGASNWGITAFVVIGLLTVLGIGKMKVSS
ncbi:HEAT repeat domain-containing protein [Akkermansiaceae bacterium]|nr:HEAT repeat domain-containing protein [Akkermansiaceae bacterium]